MKSQALRLVFLWPTGNLTAPFSINQTDNAQLWNN